MSYHLYLLLSFTIKRQSVHPLFISICFSLYHTSCFFITRPCSGLSYSHNILVSILILLSGDIQSNPDSTQNSSHFNICILNIRSLTNPSNYTAVFNLAQTHNIHVFSHCISHNTTSPQQFDAISPGFSFISKPRPILLIHQPLLLSVAARDFSFVSLAHFSPHLTQFSNHLNSQLSWSRFLVQILLYTISFAHLNLLLILDLLQLFLSFLKNSKLLSQLFPPLLMNLSSLTTFIFMSMTQLILMPLNFSHFLIM